MHPLFKTLTLGLATMAAVQNVGSASADDDLKTLIDKASIQLSCEFGMGLRAVGADKAGEIQLTELVKTLKSVGVGSADSQDRYSKWLAEQDSQFLALLDSNQDGLVSDKEVTLAIHAALTKSMESRTSLDGDGDGRLSKKEYATGQRPKFGKMDSDGLDGHGRSHFKREDDNGDSYISIVEETFARSKPRIVATVRRLQICLRLGKVKRADKESFSQEEFSKTLKPETTKKVSIKIWKTLLANSPNSSNSKKSPSKPVDSSSIKTRTLSARLSKMNKEALSQLDKNLR